MCKGLIVKNDTFNRTIEELKYGYFDGTHLKPETFNRTIEELKSLLKVIISPGPCAAFNRTIEELKFVIIN